MTLKFKNLLNFSCFSSAFSLIELMISLITISCITAAFTPVITKKLKNANATVTVNKVSSVESDCTAFSEDCQACMMNVCLFCNKFCSDDEYLNIGRCVCEKCTEKFNDINCIECSSKKCTRCVNNMYLENNVCTNCPDGYYCTNGIDKIICPAGSYCKNGTVTPCPSGTYSTSGAISCNACTNLFSNCTTCTSAGCTACATNYKLDNGKCVPAGLKYTYSGSSKESAVSGGKIIYFYSSGVFNVTSSPASPVSMFLVGGGGAGGWDCAGGGGGGYVKTVMSHNLAVGRYQITIGAGGTPQYQDTGGAGGTTYFSNIYSAGGGGGGLSWKQLGDWGCALGGSGGSAGACAMMGNGYNHPMRNGGTNGGIGTNNCGTTYSQNVSTEFEGTRYAGGGGGGNNNSVGGAGGAGGGGNGGKSSSSGTAGAANTGGGGGGGGCSGGINPNGSGGSGIVVIRTYD